MLTESQIRNGRAKQGKKRQRPEVGGLVKTNKISYRKLANGKIVKSVDEQYLRSDLPSGLSKLSFKFKGGMAESKADADMASSGEGDGANEQSCIYIIDHLFALNQIDTIENCSTMSNIVVPDTVLRYLNRKNIQSFHGLRNTIDGQEGRYFHYFYNENCQETYLDESSEVARAELTGKGLDDKLRYKVALVLRFYMRHLEGLGENPGESVFILTDSQQSKKAYLDVLASDLVGLKQEERSRVAQLVLTLNEYIQKNKKEFPELINFAGFMGDDEVVRSDVDFLSECNQEARTQIYEDHLTFDEMMFGVKEGRFFQGRFAVSRLVATEASVKVSGLNQDILIGNIIDQNRALNGDIVCIELLPEECWIDNYKSTEPVNALLDDAQEVDKISMASKDEDEEEKIVNLIELVNSQESKQVTGKVRGVLKKLNKTYGGSIIKKEDMLPSTVDKYNQFLENHNIQGKELTDQYRVFVPYNVQLPQSIMRVQNPEALEQKRIIVRFSDWLPTSPFPVGQFVKIVGEEGKLGTETNMILHEFNVDMRPFSQRVLNCLPKEGRDWQISDEEAAKRWDLRHLNVCSVDPPGCKDIDDALHCIRLPNGNFQVGVHIADVTHFVRAGTEIDKEAARRCTTVYMVDRRTDMLPGLLTESLCSLVCHVDRCAFSVLFEIDSTSYDTVDVKFGKSIIRSRESLSYYKAQEMMDDPDNHEELTESLRGLLEVATALRDRRHRAGALTLSSPEVKFKLDTQSQNPTDVTEYKHVDAHYMIEEFMLLANIAVAEKIAMHYPTFAILRRHPKPKDKEIKQLSEQLARFGMDISVETSKKFAESLDKANRPNDPYFNKLVRIMATRCMNQALYFPLGDVDLSESFHYGLAAALYTHFTSPIRRYADVLVHRLLAAAIDIASLSNDMTDKFKLAKQCDQMNRKNRMAQLSSQASVQFNTFQFFKTQPDPAKRFVRGIIMRITQAGIYVQIQKYGIEGLVSEDKQLEDGSANDVVCTRIVPSVEQENAELLVQRAGGAAEALQVQLFDHLRIEIKAEIVEFRRSVNLHFRGKITAATNDQIDLD